MKLSEAMRNIHPGALDAIKQSWRQGYDWRAAHPPANPAKIRGLRIVRSSMRLRMC